MSRMHMLTPFNVELANLAEITRRGEPFLRVASLTRRGYESPCEVLGDGVHALGKRRTPILQR